MFSMEQFNMKKFLETKTGKAIYVCCVTVTLSAVGGWAVCCCAGGAAGAGACDHVGTAKVATKPRQMAIPVFCRMDRVHPHRKAMNERIETPFKTSL